MWRRSQTPPLLEDLAFCAISKYWMKALLVLAEILNVTQRIYSDGRWELIGAKLIFGLGCLLLQRFNVFTSTSEQSGARREKTRSVAVLVQHLSSFGQTSLPILSSFSFSAFLKPLFPLVRRGFFSPPADFHSLLRRRFDIQITFGSINSEKKNYKKKKKDRKEKACNSFSSDGTNSIRSSLAAKEAGKLLGTQSFSISEEGRISERLQPRCLWLGWKPSCPTAAAIQWG